MRNRGYKYIIKSRKEGYWLLCINATWINQMLRDRGIRPKDFRRLTYEDIAGTLESKELKYLFLELRPRNFWQMCDTVALSLAKYKDENKMDFSSRAYKQDWFLKYPLFSCEDAYEHLMDAGFQQEDAVRVMEFVRRGRCHTLGLSRDEFLQLYDVPDGLQEAFNHCRYLPRREEAVEVLLDIIENAMMTAGRQKDYSEQELGKKNCE